MREMPLEPAMAAGIDPFQRAREIQREREELQHGGGVALFSPTRRQPVTRSVIKQDWDTMLRQGVKPREVTPQFVDPRELEVLQDDPDLALARQVPRRLVVIHGYVRRVNGGGRSWAGLGPQDRQFRSGYPVASAAAQRMAGSVAVGVAVVGGEAAGVGEAPADGDGGDGGGDGGAVCGVGVAQVVVGAVEPDAA
jgi:hypothetical protein